MKIGIIGLPNVGKSTFFNALTQAGASAENYPFCTIDPNIGVVEVPDKRLDILHQLNQDKEKTPVTIEFVDIAGLVEGASEGEGLGNQFLSHIREVDAILHVVRCFQDENIAHVDGTIDPLRDIEIINTELKLADLEIINKQIEKTERMLKSGEKKYKEKLGSLSKISDTLKSDKNVRELNLNETEIELIKEYQLLTAKPIIYLANIAESDIEKKDNKYIQKIKSKAEKEKAGVLPISAKIESDIAELDEEDANMFLGEMGLDESGLDRVIQESYKLLNLITFFTVAGEKEVRATAVEKGSTAPEAAGKIHSDMERGFIKAEVVNFEDFKKYNSLNEAREHGLLRQEGKEYIIKDGDICYFKFNV
ncbi:MAG: redox-regulated ATPase YchF [Bacillota bacterium]